MPITKAELEAQNAAMAKALELATAGPAAEQTAKAAAPEKVTKLAGFERIGDTSYAIGQDGTFKTHVSIVSLKADGTVKMSTKKPGSPYKPLRLPVAVAEALSGDPSILAGVAESVRAAAE